MASCCENPELPLASSSGWLFLPVPFIPSFQAHSLGAHQQWVIRVTTGSLSLPLSSVCLPQALPALLNAPCFQCQDGCLTIPALPAGLPLPHCSCPFSPPNSHLPLWLPLPRLALQQNSNSCVKPGADVHIFWEPF